MKRNRARICVLVLAAPLLLLSIDPAAAAEQGQPREDFAPPKARVLVAYYSRHGNTERFAQGVAEGARRVPDTLVTVKRVEDVAKEDLQAADAIALGAATYFAGIPGTMKTVIDDWNWKWKVDFTDKVGGAFSTGGGQTGGKEFVVVSLLMFMINNRMVVAGPLYQDAEGEDIWGEAGASAMTGPLDPGVSEKELDAARLLGERLATLARKLRSKQPRLP
ncbi:MAG: NAD(P)H-dependent oxidoreductase [Thermoguttaceae bacterium]|jgi:NAD(P)H dehydrogenase (quinone)